MSIKYKMIERKDYYNSEDKKKNGYYPQIVRSKTIKIKDISKKVAAISPLGAAYAEGLVRTLLECIETELLNGNSVCFEEFGTFSLTAKCKETNDPSKIRAESIHVKRVVFIASKALNTRLKIAKFEKVKN